MRDTQPGAKVPRRPAVAVAEVPPTRVALVLDDISFGDLVVFQIKAALASIPALVILGSILGGVGFVVFSVLAAIGVGLTALGG